MRWEVPGTPRSSRCLPTMADLRSGAIPLHTGRRSSCIRGRAPLWRETGHKEGDRVAKSGKGGSTGSADGKGTAKDRARLEKHLQKALDLEAKRRKQVSEATAGVKDLRAQLVALDGGRKAAPRGTSPVKAAAAKSALAKAAPANVATVK